MPSEDTIVTMLAAALAKRGPLGPDDEAALRALPLTVRTLEPKSFLVREAMPVARCTFVASGFAIRHKMTANGGRQILALLVPGGFADLQQILLRTADYNVQALTAMTLGSVPADRLADLALHRPAIGRAVWSDVLAEGAMEREMLLNIGRRDAMTRLAHLFCELEVRLHAAGLGDRGYTMPLTQEQIGDLTGLTAVHVNRMIKQLCREGLIDFNRRFLTILDWQRLQDRGEFTADYLQLDRPASPRG